MKKINLTLTVLLINMLLLPAFAVDDGSNYFYSSQSVGIQQRVPTATLHVNGTALFDTGAVTFSSASPVTFNDLALVNNSIQIPTGASAGFVLTSNATGVASWSSLASLPSNGDDLGNHTATTDINLANNNINLANTVNASTLISDNMTINNNAFINNIQANGFRMPFGAAVGRVFSTDAAGNASWTSLTSLPSNGDNLGNHNATTTLNLAGNDITNVDDITANRYFGDGSNLTGVNASNGTVNNTTVNNSTINNPVVNNAYLQDPTINGTATFTSNSQTIFNGGLRITTGAAPGHVLTTDAAGNTSWSSIATLPGGGGDDLGNHIATVALNMNNNNITNANEITANRFFGDGSNLTGVASSGGSVNNTTINNSTINDTTIDNGNVTNTTITNSTVANTDINNSTVRNTQITNSEFSRGVIHDSFINGSYLQDPTINGTATFEENSIAVFQGEIMIQTNAGTGKILTSDSEGNARWISATTINTNGDNMGNHTATRELNMASKDISDAGTITANRFDGGVFNGSFTGDGSGLKGINNIFTLVDNAITNNGDAASLNNDFVIGSNTVNYSGESSRLYFDKSKAAFRAGASNNQQWNDNNVGFGSVAFGNNNIAKGVTSAAFGTTNEATGEYSMTWGQNNTSRGAQSTTWGSLNSANGTSSTAWGQQSRAIGAQSTAFGVNNRSEGLHSIAFGANSTASGRDSIAMGYLTKASGDLSIAIGRGNSTADKFENSINQSLAIGFRTNASTLFVGPGFGGRTLGKVGIGTNTPQDLLDVNGRIRVNQFRMITGSGADKVLTSDAIGNATWKSIGSIAGSSDNLGNHIATKNLDMGGFDITNAGSFNQKVDDLTDAKSDHAKNTVFIGNNSGNAVTTTERSTAVGVDSLKSLTSGTNNTAVGYLAMHGLTTGYANTAIGTRAGSGLAAAAIGNTNIGARTMSSFNSAFGAYNPQATGTYNVNIGERAGGGLYAGNNNVNIGADAGLYMSDTSNNVAIGYQALRGLEEGDGNSIAIGYRANSRLVNGNKNIVIGHDSSVTNRVDTTFRENNIVIGNNISDDLRSNTLNIGHLIKGRLPSVFNPNEQGSVEINGHLKFGFKDIACSSSMRGEFRYNPSKDESEFCNGNAWIATSEAIRRPSEFASNSAYLDYLASRNMDPSADGDWTPLDLLRIINWKNRDHQGGSTLDRLLRLGVYDLNEDGTISCNDFKDLYVKVGSRGFDPTSCSDSFKYSITVTGNISAQEEISAKEIRANEKLKVGTYGEVGDASIYARSAKENAIGTRVYAEIVKPEGWADFCTVERDTPNSAPRLKWEFGSTGDTRPNGDGGQNAFYIFQMTDKNDNFVGGSPNIGKYRLHINDSGNVSIGGTNATNKLEVDGKVKATGIQLTSGAGAGKVLTSDALGNATWQTASSGNSGGNSGLVYRGTGFNSIIFKTSTGNTGLAKATGESSIAAGLDVEAKGMLSVALNNATKAFGNLSVAVNTGTQATGDASFAAGSYTRASGNQSVAFGASGNASGFVSTKFGEGGVASGRSSTVIGSNSTASGDYSFAFGRGNKAEGTSSTAGGTNSSAAGNSSIVLGSNVHSTGNNNVVIGSGYNYGLSLNYNIPDSLAIGFKSQKPTFFVGPANASNGIGKVGIGTTNPNNTLEVIGTAAKTGGGSWSNASDKRLKDIHGDYEYGLKEILDLKTIRFSYKKDNARSLPSDTKEIGFVAQEVQKVIPDAVTKGEDGYYELNVHAINVAMVNAVQELKGENDALKDELKELKSLICLDHPNASVCK